MLSCNSYNSNIDKVDYPYFIIGTIGLATILAELYKIYNFRFRNINAPQTYKDALQIIIDYTQRNKECLQKNPCHVHVRHIKAIAQILNVDEDYNKSSPISVVAMALLQKCREIGLSNQRPKKQYGFCERITFGIFNYINNTDQNINQYNSEKHEHEDIDYEYVPSNYENDECVLDPPIGDCILDESDTEGIMNENDDEESDEEIKELVDKIITPRCRSNSVESNNNSNSEDDLVEIKSSKNLLVSVDSNIDNIPSKEENTEESNSGSSSWFYNLLA